MAIKLSGTRLTSRRLRFVGIAGIVVVALFASLNYWILVRPRNASQQFVRFTLNEQFDEAAKMVSIPSKIVTDGHSHQIIARDGSNEVIPKGAELHVLDEPKRLARTGIGDYLFGRMHFQICAIWKSESESHFVPIYCTSIGSTVVIDHVGIEQ
jgi:hypothetical protein